MRVLFDTSVLVNYLRDENSPSSDALFVANQVGDVLISIVSLMELYKPNKEREQVEREVEAIRELCRRFNMRIVCVTKKGQHKAEQLVRKYHANLGKSAVPDALILATGIQWRAYVVTHNVGAWKLVYERVLSVEEFLQEFA